MKIIEANIEDKFCGYTSEKHQWVVDNFKMPIPNKVRMHFCENTLGKMKDAIALTNSKKFHNISFLSSTRKDAEHCFVEFFLNDHLIEISKYEDFDRYFDTCDSDTFKIYCDSIYPDSFKARFLYFTGSGLDFAFKTSHFKI